MSSITCPDCATVVEIADMARTAREFCPACDYPLFWAIQAVTPVAASGGSLPGDGASRRLPGAAGRRPIASAACPTCAELNPVMAETCGRCGGRMELEP